MQSCMTIRSRPPTSLTRYKLTPVYTSFSSYLVYFLYFMVHGVGEGQWWCIYFPTPVTVGYAYTHVWLHFLLNACPPLKETSTPRSSAHSESLGFLHECQRTHCDCPSPSTPVPYCVPPLYSFANRFLKHLPWNTAYVLSVHHTFITNNPLNSKIGHRD